MRFRSAVSLFTAVFLLGTVFSFYPLKQDEVIGQEIQKNAEHVITTKSEATGKSIVIDIKAGSEYLSEKTLSSGYVIKSIPQVAIWLQDDHENYIETLYISEKSASGNFSKGKNRRPEALPAWSHARGVKAKDGLFMPDKSSAVVDGLTGATPLVGFSVVSKYKEKSGLNVMIEVNKSFDDNDYYNKDNITNDEAYAQNPNGQPSLIYRAELNQETPTVMAELIGHGHISGADGTIDPDVSKLTTALEMFEGIVITIK